jgi:Ran GTPase-activating protein (RanGAP) involved in mRNA processing and transport
MARKKADSPKHRKKNEPESPKHHKKHGSPKHKSGEEGSPKKHHHKKKGDAAQGGDAPSSVELEQKSAVNLRRGSTVAEHEIMQMLAEKNPKLTEVKLGKQEHFGNGGCKQVAYALDGNPHVKVLWLNDDQIKDDGVRALAQVLKTTTALEEVNLSNDPDAQYSELWNHITDLGAKFVLEALKTNTVTSVIDLSGNDIAPGMVENIERILGLPKIVRRLVVQIHDGAQHLEDINVSKMDLDCDAAVALAEVLTGTLMCKNLSMARNRIKGAGCVAIASMIKTIQEISTKGTTVHYCSLVTLKLSENNIGDRGAKDLGLALKENQTLEELFIDSNGIGEQGASFLAKGLQKNGTLKKLYLDNNNVSTEGAKALAAVLEDEFLRGDVTKQVNTTLEALWLSNNNIGAEGGKALIRKLVSFGGSVSTIILEGNDGIIKM